MPSIASKQLIIEHISKCEECRKIYEITNAPIPEMIDRRVDEQIDLYSPGYTRHSAGEILDK